MLADPAPGPLQRAQRGAPSRGRDLGRQCLRSLLARLRLANAGSCQAERKVDELCAALSRPAAAEPAGPCDADVLRSLPGIGTVILAILPTEAGDPLARRDHAALRALSGVAPVTKRSGTTRIAVMRHAAHVRLRRAVFHWARAAIARAPNSRSRYV